MGSDPANKLCRRTSLRGNRRRDKARSHLNALFIERPLTTRQKRNCLPTPERQWLVFQRPFGLCVPSTAKIGSGRRLAEAFAVGVGIWCCQSADDWFDAGHHLRNVQNTLRTCLDSAHFRTLQVYEFFAILSKCFGFPNATAFDHHAGIARIHDSPAVRLFSFFPIAKARRIAWRLRHLFGAGLNVCGGVLLLPSVNGLGNTEKPASLARKLIFGLVLPLCAIAKWLLVPCLAGLVGVHLWRTACHAGSAALVDHKAFRRRYRWLVDHKAFRKTVHWIGSHWPLRKPIFWPVCGLVAVCSYCGGWGAAPPWVGCACPYMPDS